MLWWTLRRLRSNDQVVRERAARTLLQSKDRQAVAKWQPEDSALRGLRVLALREWDLAATLPHSDIVMWLSLIIQALEQDPPHPFGGADEADKIERFFSSLVSIEAMPHLVRALMSDVWVATHEVSRRRLGVTRTETVCVDWGGSWKGSWEKYEEREIYKVELIFDSRNPVADGAKKALIDLAAAEPRLGVQLEEALTRTLSRSRKPLTCYIEESEVIGGYTNSEYEAR